MTPEGPLLGVAIVTVAGLISGMFTLPSLGITAWRWEHVWLVYSLSAYALMPVGIALLFSPGILPQIAGAPALTARVTVCGLLFGIGSLLFGVSWKKLGMAVANALVSGVIVMVGSIGPVLVGAARLDRRGWLRLAVGLAPLVASLGLGAAAGISRDRARQSVSSHPVSFTKSMAGIGIAIASGVLSAMLNIGFALGNPLIESAARRGASPFLATMAVWIPILLGGLAINFGYTALLIHSGGAWRTLLPVTQGFHLWSRCLTMGVLWFGAIALYGYGAGVMGEGGTVYGWALVSGAGVMGSNIAGAIGGEWKQAGPRPKLLMGFATALLMVSFALLGAP